MNSARNTLRLPRGDAGDRPQARTAMGAVDFCKRIDEASQWSARPLGKDVLRAAAGSA